ncbi:MAG TPA: hypothetical protein PLI65_04150 [Bacteroidales bacterium]|nr:hypothetical protein [Bacteroidales bacterium]HPR56965.1 hypothetical protein [Bacteroidales bacterium]HRW96265.1 hypothetical protein [Bacteroidales bacterium]
MKKINILLLFSLLIVVFTFTQCLKLDDPVPSEPEKTSELEISSDFNWSTNRQVELKLGGIPGAVDNQKTLIVRNGNKVFLKQLYNINQNLQQTIIVPVHIQELTMQFGNFSKTFGEVSTAIEYSFVPDVEEPSK